MRGKMMCALVAAYGPVQSYYCMYKYSGDFDTVSRAVRPGRRNRHQGLLSLALGKSPLQGRIGHTQYDSMSYSSIVVQS